ncbi:uncharacterized protein LOC111271169 isoform X2 [Varroa jacobsoni]|nr:uncharacterized protein LOC111253820 isoform X2 [Varroa destructor]XP_022669623.1 uncharacterized protein LOC111253820 isoform X2 [Varroa destructor]XP_022707524.1 uncharacterized protein LOC111271169 isoform X2 [Varroa jacobsoni]XP_022707525.1 uncharacterized protein LOC111271169 isoform X2 [Varroa jacobsoni]
MDYMLRLVNGEAEPYRLEALPVPDFNVTVNSNWFTNRAFKAKFQKGTIRGLTRIRRKGDCQPTRWIHGNITLVCTLDLSTIIASYEVNAKGHSLNPRTDWMDVHVKVEVGTAGFEAQSFPNRPPYIKTFIIQLPFELSVRRVPRKSPIDLNEGRSVELTRQIVQYAERAIQDAVLGTYLKALTRVMTKNSDVLILPPVK